MSSRQDHDNVSQPRQAEDDRAKIDRLDARIKAREDDRTKKVASRKNTRGDTDFDKMEETRKKSRIDYLNKRAPKQIAIYEEDIKDEKSLFAESFLTKAELERLKYKEKVLTLTKDHMEAGEKARRRQYYMPDSRNDLDEDEFDEQDNKDEPNSEQKIWERLRFEAANVKYDAKTYDDHLNKLFAQFSDYDLLKNDKEFCDRVRRCDKFEEYFIDPKVAERKAKENARREMSELRKRLPVYERRDELLQAISENQVIIVQGETGCGKTTQIPQYLHEEGYTKTELKTGATVMVGCTQPRRVAAMSVAARVSQEIGSKLGHTVGYSIRFEDCTSEGTVIKYMTDGMLLRELLDDPILSKYSVMIVDEAHERTLHTDILLTLLKDVTRARADFRLIISSATLDEQKFSRFFDDPPIFKIKGRLFKVEHKFMKPDQKETTSDYIKNCCRTVMHIHRTEQSGDILVFLPGQEEIEELQRMIEEAVKHFGKRIRELMIRPIYANLPTDMQSKVFDKTPEGARKVVIATNIAETSLTIDGIVFVVDPGYCKQNRFSHKTGMETLAITRISKASADQRAGRAGRNRPGICFRLYTKDEYDNEFEENTKPEIQRLNLANVVLLLKTMKINDVIEFEYVDRPQTEVLLFAVEQLTALGALDQKGELTYLGRRMAEFPLEPKMSKSIIVSETFGCSEEILTIMSMLSINGAIFFKPKGKEVHAEASRKSFFSITGDHMMLLKVYNDWESTNFSKDWCFEKYIQYKSMSRARDVREQLEKLCDKVEVKLVSDRKNSNSIRKAILSGFFYNVARISRDGGTYKTIKKNLSVYIHPTSALQDSNPRWIVFNEIKQTTKEYLRTISEIEPSWLVEVAPCFYDKDEIEEMAKKKMPKFKKGKSRAELNPTYG